MDKVKNALHLNKDTTTTTHTTGTTHNNGVPEGTAGPHSSRAANAADPRIDSDLDSTRHTGTGVGGVGSTTHGTHGTHTGATGLGSNTHGTHGTHTGTGVGGVGSTTHGTHTGTTGLGSSTHGTTGTTGSTGYSGTHAGNTHGTHTGTTGGISHSTNAGPHNSNLANKADPRVDSDLDGRGNRHGAATGGVFGASGSHATAGSGTAQNTAGPHNSDLANKLDPRVDSDRDGSKTIGGNKTHA